MAYENEEAQETKEVFSEKEIESLKEVGSDLSMTHRFDPSTLSWATDIIARLGGWKGNPKQSPPGPITLKRGLGSFINAGNKNHYYSRTFLSPWGRWIFF